MRKKIRYMFTLLLSVLLIIQLLGVYQTASDIVDEQDGDEEMLRMIVYDFENGHDEIRENDDINVIGSYDSFTVIETTKTQAEAIEERGYMIDRVISENRPYWISKESFDSLQNIFTQKAETGVYILEFTAPLKQSWREELKGEGFEFYERTRGFSYLVRYDGKDIDRFTKKSFIESYSSYGPEYKIDEDLIPHLKDKGSLLTLKLKLTSDSDSNTLKESIEPFDGELITFQKGTLDYNSATIRLDSSKLRYLARNPHVLRVSEKPRYELLNDDASWVVQSFDTSDKVRTIWDKGIYGQNQIIGIADTGIDYDHAMFRHAENEVGEPGEDHRKVVSYHEYADHKDTDYSGHGTHVTGSAVGDWKSYGEPDEYDGMAPAGKVAFFDIGKDGDALEIPDDLNELFQAQYDSGARIFSNSWGSNASYYTSSSEECDEFMWNNNDALILFANGNSGPENNTVSSPASAKNVVSVGNSINDVSEDMASSSSKGPTDEWRLKPTVAAPGTSIISADSDGDLTTMNDGLTTMTGTSMATPIVAGSTALVRQYYMDGWYPSGDTDEQNGFVPSGSLLKATLINSAWSMEGEYTGGAIPSNGQGWGKVNLEDALYFEGDSRKLEILNNGSEEEISTSGESHEHEIYVEEGQDLKITLAWTDYPGASLQNDLNLLVEDPNGNTFRGNVFSEGYSESGGNFDDNNVSEQVFLKRSDLIEGKYTIKVIGESISVSPQRYSLLTTGEVVGTTESISFGHEKYNKYPITDDIGVRLQSPSSNEDSTKVESHTVVVNSTTDAQGESLTLFESNEDSGIFTGNISITNESGKEGILQVMDGDSVEVKFEYNNSKVLTATTRINSNAPKLVDLNPPSPVDNTLLPHTAKISWTTDIMAYGKLEYGVNKRLDNTATHPFYSYNSSVILEDLKPNTRYYYKLIFVDECEKSIVAVEDNQGALYTFKTPRWPTVIGEGYSGYVQSISDNTDSIFDEDYFYSGYYYEETLFGPQEGPFYSAIMFETNHISELDIRSAALHLTPKSSYSPSDEEELWKFEVLEDTVENAFPDPSYSQINNAEPLFTIDELYSSELADVDDIDILDISDEHLDRMEENLNDGNLVVRIKGPTDIEYTNVKSWYSGHQISNEGDLFNAPQLRINDFESSKGKLRLDKDYYSDDDFVHIELLYETSEDYVDVSVSSNSDPTEIRLQETRNGTNTFTGHVELNGEDGLSATHGEVLEVEFINQDSKKLTDTATVDTEPPSISNITTDVRNDLSAVISWESNKPASSTTVYGGTEELGGEVYDSQYKTEHEVRLTGLTTGMDYHYKIISTDEAGNSQVADNDGSPFTFKTPSSNIQPSILLVEDAGDTSNYKTALDDLDLNYDFESTAGDTIPSSELKHYDIVVWVVGGFTDTLTLRERELIAGYLENGGNLYLNGEDIGYDIGETSFYRDYLHSEFIKVNGDGEEISGFQSDPISGGLNDLSIGGTYPDLIAPADSYATPAFYYNTGDNASIRAETDNYKLVYMACEFFEGSEEQNLKTELMGNITDWFNPMENDEIGPFVGLDAERYNELNWNETLEFDTIIDDSIARGSAIETAEFYMDTTCDESDGRPLEKAEMIDDESIARFTGTLETSELSYGNHFLYIRGQDEKGNWGDYSRFRFEIVNDDTSDLKTYSKNLSIDGENDGWNFISTNLIPEEDELSSVLDEQVIDLIEKVLYYDSESDEWNSYMPSRSDHFNDDIPLDQTMGIWIRVADDCKLTFSGYEPDSTKITVNPGWNMIGYPSSTTTTENIPEEVTKIGYFDATKNDNIAYEYDTDNFEFEPGKGYWIYNDADYTVEYWIEY